jgi:predicted nucleotidyltransferase
VQEHLEALERQHGVRILYACESGSRAWGFASQDSDYDVRFLYVHPLEHYLSFRVEMKRDVIEAPLEGDLDLNGWDLRKAMQLLLKSNGALVEWLTSPIVYRQGLAELRQALPEIVSPRSLGFHYLQMARGTVRELAEPEVRLKRCFYALRPTLAARWLEQKDSLPPVAFKELRATLPDELQETVDRMLARKAAGSETDREALDPAMRAFLEGEVERLGPVVAGLAVSRPDLERMDALFRAQLTAG